MKNKLSLLLIVMLTLTGCTTNNSSSANNDTKLLESFLHGKGVPSSDMGYDFSYYYDEETRFVYEKNRGEWINTYTIGGESLYENISQMSEEVSSRKLKNGHHKGHKEKQELINSIARSYYSTDITMRFNTELDFSLMDFKRNKNFAEVPGGTDENGNIINDYLRYNPAGHEILNDGKWEKIIDLLAKPERETSFRKLNSVLGEAAEIPKEGELQFKDIIQAIVDSKNSLNISDAELQAFLNSVK